MLKVSFCWNEEDILSNFLRETVKFVSILFGIEYIMCYCISTYMCVDDVFLLNEFMILFKFQLFLFW
jgi:hypothetical protein